MSDASAINEIVVNLDDQVRVYRRLLDLSQAQLVALQAQDVRTVHAILQEIELAMLERSKVDQRRSEVLMHIAQQLGIALEDVTASLLQQRADAPIGEAIANASAELRGLVGDLDGVVARNRALLEHELAIIDHMVHGMTTVPDKPTYAADGGQREAARLKLLDAQV